MNTAIFLCGTLREQAVFLQFEMGWFNLNRFKFEKAQNSIKLLFLLSNLKKQYDEEKLKKQAQKFSIDYTTLPLNEIKNEYFLDDIS